MRLEERGEELEEVWIRARGVEERGSWHGLAKAVDDQQAREAQSNCQEPAHSVTLDRAIKGSTSI